MCCQFLGMTSSENIDCGKIFWDYLDFFLQENPCSGYEYNMGYTSSLGGNLLFQSAVGLYNTILII